MAQDIYAAARAHTRRIPADQTPEAVLARYREANPDDTGATVLVPGQEGYEGPATLDPQAQVYVKDRPLTDSRLRAAVEAERRYGGDGGLNTLAQGTTFGFLDEGVGRLAQVEQMATNLGRRLTGQPIEIESRDLNDAVVETIRGGTDQFARERPVASFGLMALGALPSGGAALGRGVTGAAVTGGAYGTLAGAGSAEGGFVERVPEAALGGAVGTAAGGALGAATPFAQRLGSIASAGTRRIIPARQSVAERFAPLIDDAAYAERARLQELGLRPSVMDVLPQRAERLVRTAAGPAGPGAEAAVTRSRALTQNLKSDVMSDTRALTGDPRSASQVRAGLLETRSNLADDMYPEAYATPVAVTDDLMSALGDDPGRAALRRARAAAVSRRNAQQVAEIDALLSGSRPLDMSPEAVAQRARDQGFNPDRTYYHGSPENISSFRTDMGGGNYGEGLYTTRMAERAAGYAGPEGAVYPLVIRPERTLDITTPEGRAIFDARKRGVSTREALGTEYDVIKAPGETIVLNENAVRSRFDQFAPEGYTPPPSEVSAGTLDRARIAMAGRARKMQQSPDTNDIASGLFDRASQIDDVLEGVPALAPARETYRNLSGAVDALDEAGQVFSLPPQDFEGIVRRLTPEQREAAIIGVRQEIMDTLGGQKPAGTGTLDRIAQAPYARQNLSMLLGEDEAARYLAQIDARVQQTQRAARVSPNTNSQTFGRAIDEDTFSAAQMVGATVDGVRSVQGDPLAFGRTLDRLRARATMSPEDRAAIVEMGLGSADELENIVQLAQTARQQGRPIPREVRAYIVNARNVLGSRSPVPQQLEQLLIPSRVVAEDQQE